MRIRSFIFVVSCLLIPGTFLSGQEVMNRKIFAGVSLASNEVKRIYVPPPKEFFLNKDRKGVNIKVYYSGFPSAAKTAFEYAVSILASQLFDTASFTIRAIWGPLAQANVLGSTSVTSAVRGSSIDALYPDTFYPVALAEKIAGKKLNTDEEGDMQININSSISWYTGTDGNPPSSKYDLVTVVLHELCHGIGFWESFTVTGTTGSFGQVPLVYDTFVEDFNGNKLTDTNFYSNNSAKLGSALTGGRIYFRGKLMNEGVRLYAPSTWSQGSSISHLNESGTYPQEALMTPFTAKAEAIHSLGIITSAILGDLGWKNTRIIHSPFTDTEKNLTNVEFIAKIKSDVEFPSNKVGLVWSFDKFISSDTSYLISYPSDTFRVSLNIPSYNTGVSYYFFVTDFYIRTYRLPSHGITAPYYFFIGTDTVKPLIDNSPPDYLLDRTTVLNVKATVNDNIGIDSVYIEYRKNYGSLYYLTMNHDSLDRYSCSVDLKSLGLTGYDSLKYRIVAVDSSSSSNTGYSPKNGYYSIGVEQTSGVVSSYTTNFTGSANDFINRGFYVGTPSRFSDPALHTVHPYESPEMDGDSIVYTSVLRYSVKADSTGMVISFMEIVLVEPGESGSVFGSTSFYDFVVVEGSKNFGETWFPMADGYDSRISTTFLNAYNSLMNGMNSTYAGTPSMFLSRKIEVNTFDKFSKSDTLLIRFRLFSDPYAHGWGWAIDDLSIKSVAADVPKTEYGDLKIYPNPGNGLINLQQTNITGQNAHYQVLNLTGTRVRSGIIAQGNNEFIDISGQPPGIYIIQIRTGDSVKAFKYTKLR